MVLAAFIKWSWHVNWY